MTIIINTAQQSGIKHLQINVRFKPDQAIDMSTTHNDMDLIRLHVCKASDIGLNMTLGGLA